MSSSLSPTGLARYGISFAMKSRLSIEPSWRAEPGIPNDPVSAYPGLGSGHGRRLHTSEVCLLQRAPTGMTLSEQSAPTLRHCKMSSTELSMSTPSPTLSRKQESSQSHPGTSLAYPTCCRQEPRKRSFDSDNCLKWGRCVFKNTSRTEICLAT